ncbi:MAG TPA: succinate dehydrogenase, cytochrome b556 subunit [Usitatibacter sp.]|jgi:succinate dehydrogenase / fumarate reductase cytochrome b subunit|nr:succinate dehydrogenase, cytochrome b556 subunit [Usitatibacter sp.]
MSSTPASRAAVRRPKYYDLSLAHLPPPGLVSIFHRVSGLLLFFPVLPLLLWFLQSTLASEEGFHRFAGFYAHPIVKLVLLAFVWAYAHHFFAGIRYLFLDMHMGVAKQPARTSAVAVLVLGVLTTIAVGVCIW